MKNLNELSKEIHKSNVDKGFYDEQPRNIGEILALIHAEVSEALEAHRDNKFSKPLSAKIVNEIDEDDSELFKESFLAHVKDTFQDEIADSIIRLLDLCGYMDINIEEHIAAKLRYNKTRGHKHGKNY